MELIIRMSVAKVDQPMITITNQTLLKTASSDAPSTCNHDCHKTRVLGGGPLCVFDRVGWLVVCQRQGTQTLEKPRRRSHLVGGWVGLVYRRCTCTR